MLWIIMQVNKQIYTLGFCFNKKKDKVVLIKKKRPDWQKGKLNGIGGSINECENDYEAQVREFFEETGVRNKNLDWTLYCTLAGKEFLVFCYYCVNEDYFQAAKTNTDEKVVKIKVKDLGKYKTISNLKWLIYAALNKEEDKKLKVLTVEYR